MNMTGFTMLFLYKHTSHLKLPQQTLLACLKTYNKKYSFEMENRQSLSLENAVKQIEPEKG